MPLRFWSLILVIGFSLIVVKTGLLLDAAFFGLAAFALIAKTARSASVKIFFM